MSGRICPTVYGEHPVEEVVLNGGDAYLPDCYDEIRQSPSSLYPLLSSLPVLRFATRDISLPSDTIGYLWLSHGVARCAMLH